MRLVVVARGQIIASLLLLLTCGSSWAVTRIVPTQFPTIQAAMVASAASGDTVLVNPGTYHEKVNFLGKEIVLRSLAGADVTTIDAAGLAGPAVLLLGVGQRGRVIGFTIKNGTGLESFGILYGGGLRIRECTGDGPLISDNVVTNNSADVGGGVSAAGPARVVRNRILNNSSHWNGGGIHCGGKIIVTDNEIVGNVDHFQEGYGGGVSIGGGGALEFARNMIACNEAASGGGCSISGSVEGVVFTGNTVILNRGVAGVGGCSISLWVDRFLEFRSNAVAFNFQGGGIDCRRVGLAEDLDSSCNDVWGNGPDFLDDECGPFIGVNNNLQEDPIFGVFTGCPPGSNAYCLDDESPLLSQNSPPGCGLIGARGLCGAIGIADEITGPRGRAQSRLRATESVRDPHDAGDRSGRAGRHRSPDLERAGAGGDGAEPGDAPRGAPSVDVGRTGRAWPEGSSRRLLCGNPYQRPRPRDPPPDLALSWPRRGRMLRSPKTRVSPSHWSHALSAIEVPAIPRP